jgi:Glycosyl transferase family 11
VGAEAEVRVKVVLREWGGLGNQLFQYAALRYYAKRYGADMHIAADPDWNAQCNGYPRPCLLSHFLVSAPLAERSMSDRILMSDRAWLKAAARPWKRTHMVQVFTEQVEQRYCFLRDLPLEPGVRTLYLRGYFQTSEMVEAVADELRVDLTLKEPAKGKNLELLRQIRRSRNPVSLHVRRGDSTLPWEGKVVLPMEYYAHAISTMRERFVDPDFFVFSDDMSFVKESLPRGARMVFVEHNDDFASHEDLRLMSACHHHIIANSTFSWWGAWLNSRAEKVVIAPRHWFLAGDNYRTLLRRDWILDEVATETFV